MIYGKVECAIASEHGRLHVTICDPVVSLKQGSDLIRLSLDEACELASDISGALRALELSNTTAKNE